MEKHIGEARANDITSADLKRLQWRLNDDGYAPGTINRLVTTAYGALKLAERSGNLFGKLPQAPKQLKRPKPRQGFLEHDDYLAISAELPDWGKDVFEMFYSPRTLQKYLSASARQQYPPIGVSKTGFALRKRGHRTFD